MSENQEPKEDEINMDAPEKPISTIKILEKSRKVEKDKEKQV